MEEKEVKKSGLNVEGLIGLILAILAFAGSVIAFTQVSIVIQIISTVLCIAAFVYCKKGRKNGKDKTLAIIGLIINIIGLLFSLFVYFMFITGGLAKTAVGIAKDAGAFSF